MTSRPPGIGKVWLVGAGPGDPDLITCRGVSVLGAADVVLHDALSHPELLEFCPRAEIRDVGKRYGERSPPQEVITRELVELALTGKRVVRLKGGDPMMFARGAEEALALVEAGIPFEIVPGISSPVAASEFAGISLTHREASSSVTFITGSDREGLEWSPEAWKKLATATGTICVLMGMRRIEAITRAILDGGRAADTPAAVVMWGARPEQRTVTGTLVDIAEKARAAGLSSPSIIIIGEVVALREQLNWYESKPLFGRRVLVPRPRVQARETVLALRARGAAPVVRPAIEIEASPEPERFERAVSALSSYDLVLFTSANGVEATFDVLTRLKRDARAFGAARVGVIGPKTGAALARRGITADLEAREYVAESLLERIFEGGNAVEDAADGEAAAPRRVLLLRAQEARDVLPEGLRARGVEVDVVAAYRTRPAAGEEREALARALEAEVDAVLFTSSSMVSSVVDALGTGAVEMLSRLQIVCIGPITARTARDLGVRVDVESKIFTVEGALDAWEDAVGSSTKAAVGDASEAVRG